MKSGTEDKLEGTLHQVKGKPKEVAGKLTDNPKMEGEGFRELVDAADHGPVISMIARGKNEKVDY
jgi:uncharacterized protein YjbJ (UPF0337 family)